MSQLKRATLYDVAEHAGVSYQTVSRVINASPHVSPQTLRRVQNAIRALDYQPNKAAQMLVTRRSFTLEMIMVGAAPAYYGPSQMMTSVEQAARASGFKLIYSSIDSNAPDQMQYLSDNLGTIDGLIVITPIQDALIDDILRLTGRPFVKIGTEQGMGLPSVIIDQRFGSRLAVQYLLDLGHRRIAEISGPLNWYDAAARHEGWLSTLSQHHLGAELSVQADWTAEGGYHAAQTLLGRRETFTALVAGNDQMALGAMRALREHRLRIPEDVSVIGFDDTPESAFFEPPLTTIRQDFRAMGTRSVEYLVDMISDRETPLQQHILYPQLIVRHSTATR